METKTQGLLGEMQPRIEKLTRCVFQTSPLPLQRHLKCSGSQLDCVHESLDAIQVYSNGRVMPIINSSNIRNVLNECDRNIDDFLKRYNVRSNCAFPVAGAIAEIQFSCLL